MASHKVTKITKKKEEWNVGFSIPKSQQKKRVISTKQSAWRYLTQSCRKVIENEIH